MQVRLGLAFAALLGGCGEPSQEGAASLDTSAGSEGSSDDTDAATGGGDDFGEAPAAPSACSPGSEISGAPQTIAEAVAFVNALPHPVTLDCFLERLQRPVRLAATSSTVSLQPALGRRSPRVFLFYGDLVMSIAIDGDPGRDLLEFGELVNATQSIKGEIEFPVTEVLTVDDPLRRIVDGETTRCHLCHRGEAVDPADELAIVSDALQFPSKEAVELPELLGEHAVCRPAVEPERCARLAALFTHGEVVASPFPYELPTIYDYE